MAIRTNYFTVLSSQSFRFCMHIMHACMWAGNHYSASVRRAMFESVITNAPSVPAALQLEGGGNQKCF